MSDVKHPYLTLYVLASLLNLLYYERSLYNELNEYFHNITCPELNYKSKQI